ncbi:right-handed parallel beta-helix repeat-containing protein [Draconibacterium sp.]|nr:right-handed parallel beta-helix repeat-containing protein [Draconibacterium sp.]
MNIIKFNSGSLLIKGLLASLLLCLLSAESIAANYPLEIIQPRPNLDTKNRFYKAYPGLEYNVRLAVIGGEFPYRFALTSAPAGMTIDARGEITWENPIQSGTAYNVTVEVEDAQSTATSVSWTIVVTTSGFRFIDAANGVPASLGGTGMISSPWKSMKDMYGGDVVSSKTTNNFAGEFVYWRAGTYPMDAFKENSGSRTPFVSNAKPQVWLAYPGEKPVIDLADAHIVVYGGGSNLYFDGLDFNINGNKSKKGIQIESSASSVTFRRNKFHGITNAVTGGNGSLIFISNGNVGDYYAIQDNEFYDVGTNGYGILGYSARNVLVEDNTLHNITQHPIGPKEGTALWFIRSNHLYDNVANSINLQYSDTHGVLSGDIEISYNLVEAGGGKVRMNSNLTASGLPVYLFRNTFMDEVQVNKVTSINGLFSFSDNVIVNETSYQDKIQRNSIDNPARLIITDNLSGNASDNIVDSRGDLTANYATYVGSRGHQIGPRPVAPIVTVE